MDILTRTNDAGRSSGGVRSERGAVLLVVIILATIALAAMTTLLYMLTVGTQISGMTKRYRSALDASFGGWDVVRQVVDLQSNAGGVTTLINNLTSAGMAPDVPVNSTCQQNIGGTVYTGLLAKLLAPTTSWSAACNRSISIDPTSSGTYDISLRFGTPPSAYTVYAKVIHHQEGNTGAGYGEGVRVKSGVVSSTGELEVPATSAFYTIEIDAENTSNRNERAKLSVLYQY